MFDVIALGEALIDFACISTDEDNYPTMAAHPGGAPANFLAALQKYGAKTAFISRVGDDAFGKMLLGTLAKAGIDTSGVYVDPDTFTTLAFVTFNDEGDREFSFARKPGADTQISKDTLRYDLIDAAKVFHFGTLSLTDDPAREATYDAVRYAKEHGKLITCDPNLRKPLWSSLDEAKKQIEWSLSMADVVKISDDEVEFLFGDISYEDAAKKMMEEYGVKLVFITLGKNGCFFANGNGCGRVPGITGLKTIDTTGAGDIFGGSAVCKLLQTGKAPEELAPTEIEAIARFACTAASLSTTRPGGIFSVPEEAEVSALL